MRTKIEKQKTKRINVYFIYQEREKKGEKQTIIGENLTTISRHVSSCVEKDLITHQMRRWKAKFGH